MAGPILDIVRRLCLLWWLIIIEIVRLIHIIVDVIKDNTPQTPGQRATSGIEERREHFDAREEREMREAINRSLVSQTEDYAVREVLRSSAIEGQHQNFGSFDPYPHDHELRHRFHSESESVVSEAVVENPPYNPNYDHEKEASSLPCMDDGHTRAPQYPSQMTGFQLGESRAQITAENQPSASNSSLYLVD